MEQSIVRFSVIVHRTLTTLIAISAMVSVMLWVMATLYPAEWLDASFPVEVSMPISLERSLLGFIPAMLPVMQFIVIFYLLASLFQLYANHQIFEIGNAQKIKLISYALLATPIITLTSDLTLSFVLTYSEGDWHTNVHFSDSDLTFFIVGLVVFCISKVMLFGAEINEENQLTI
ncbi:DUF2975 domain-containing protein [Vibrio comitans]|uniref:DUF2975 domain-containing protein n=1 Tax=Vibrio comitans NBRC 102076 TaxID=1219078 RepID=A0A4Y3IRF9_9VIBR|nr:DUF2975 domain-containing protein [Vibrio comitans]GEA61926.1 hypothetical protein VCO01S_31190 [Vibrio comitans NBRC 102076]